MKKKTFRLVAANQHDRDEWKSAFEKARKLAMSSKQLLEEWNKEDYVCVRCVRPTEEELQKMEEEDEEIDEEDDESATASGYSTSSNRSNTEKESMKDFFS